MSSPPSPPPYININHIIRNLPDSLREKIYKEYFEPQVYFLEYKRAIESPPSQRLDIVSVFRLLPIILAKKKKVISYISSKCNAFKMAYRDHKTQNKKGFIRMTKGESFALSILMYLYH